MMIASWRLDRQSGRHPLAMFLVRVLMPTAASVAVALVMTCHHVVMIVATAAVPYLAGSMAISPVNWSTAASMRRKQVMA